jgi:protein gp37
MGSAIEWTEKTWNPVSGCTRASAGCDNCYAVKITKRLAAMGQEKYTGLVNEGKSHFNGVVKCHEDALKIPLKWKKPCTIFVNSMSDLFHKEVPFEFIDKVFAIMALCPRRTSSNSVWRWARKGVKARNGEIVHLRHVRMGGLVLIPEPALGEFFQEMAAADAQHFTPAPAPAPAPLPVKRGRRSADHQAMQFLKARGL